jgi:hypothetical protein
MRTLEEGIDYYYNEDGYIVLTAEFHLKKGSCCGNGCLHCPYDYINVPEQKRTELLFKRNAIKAQTKQ